MGIPAGQCRLTSIVILRRITRGTTAAAPLEVNLPLSHMVRRPWNREELIVAFNLYCKIPFGKIHIRNPQLIELAQAIRRTPSAVSWKLANFARLDPTLQVRDIAGASHGAKADIEIWEEFKSDWEKRTFESERLLIEITGRAKELGDETTVFPEGRTREAIVRTRVNQGFFRSAVLAAYKSTCCITGCSIPELLNASHIVPWAKDVKNRTNPRNGLCLNVLHDRAFDCGLLTVTPDLRVMISTKAKRKSSDVGNRELMLRYEGAPVRSPEHFVPDPQFLRFHNQKIFLGT
jgi:putative restriction endonuclease